MSEAPSANTTGVEVVVTRSGGFAGLGREWLARATDQDALELIKLVEGCPWPDRQLSVEDAPATVGADRFAWVVHARCGEAPPQQVSLTEDAVTDAWRRLIDAVRSWNDSPRD
ncbi:protealysin inhibitor emfourin (plasmid) [Coraliomargarita sp. W4R53]